MEFFWEMLSLQETMFLLILTGVLIKKLKIIDAAGRKMLSDLLIDVILPCNIVESFLGGMVFPDGFARNCLLAVGLSAVIQLMSIYGSKLLFRKYPREQRSVLSYGIICSNSSFVGLPVARLLFGDLGVIYTSMFQIPLRFTMWPAGLSLFTSVSRKDAFRKLVRHPCILAGPAAAGRRDPKNRLHEQSVFCWAGALSGPPRKGRQSRRLDAEGGLPLFLGLIRLAPVPHGVQNGFQAVPQVGQRVFHAGRDLRIDRTGQQAAPLHLPELGRQHFLADRADGLLQFSKTLCPRHQIPENEHLPLVTDQRQRGFHRTGRKFFCRGCHLQVPPVYRSLQIL